MSEKKIPALVSWVRENVNDEASLTVLGALSLLKAQVEFGLEDAVAVVEELHDAVE